MAYRPLTTLLALALVLPTALLACGEDEEDEPDDVAHEDVAEVVLVDLDTDEEIADYHDGHWHGEIEVTAEADEDESLAVGFRFNDEDDQPVDIPLGERGYDYDFQVEDVDNVVTERRDDHFRIRGADEGETSIYFDFFIDNEVFFDTQAQGLPVFVDPAEPGDDNDNNQNNDDQQLEVTGFALLDRAEDPPESIAELDENQWIGDFADGIELTVADDPSDYETAAAGDGEAVSLGADAEDGDEEPIELDGQPWELGIATGDDDVVTTEDHGDHVHVVGLEAGETAATFQLVDAPEEDVAWESPQFSFEVVQ